MATADDEELVSLAIPAQYVEQVARLIARLEAEEKQRRTPAEPEHPGRGRRPATQLSGAWTSTDLQRLIAGRGATHQTVFQILDVLAERPDEHLSTAQVCDAIGEPKDRIKGAMAGLTRVVKAHFAYDKLGLPLNREVIPETRQVFYWLTMDQAVRWQAARTAARSAIVGAGSRRGEVF